MAKAAASAPKKALSKSEVLTALAEKTGHTKKEVGVFLEALSELITGNLGKKGPGLFTIPGLAKFKKVHKPATPARKGINPLTKQEIMIKAKPARNAVKILALKALKESV